MSKKTKAYLSVFVMSLIFFMMIDTRYARALGDYIVEFIGLPSWSGDQTGLHLSIIYFGILFIVSILFVRRFAISELNLNWKNIFVYLIGLNILFTFITGTIVKSIKANANGLLAIGIEKKVVYLMNLMANVILNLMQRLHSKTIVKKNKIFT